ncbi:Sulfotransferase domain protein [Stieleria neptunia]|uniref:Sulfotransferase domain protein n=2 Tax=Stieleria neptunia TaxID=2527979 RepID=A0A518HN64_9BACT|nr:Sulfotransferase domain protein [Stieleria neptunia]
MNGFVRRLEFVAVGPQRTGTSWLHHHLRHHRELSFPLHVKETKFFDARYEKGMDWYWGHFADHSEHRLAGEICPTYFHSDQALVRLRQFDGLRVIIHLRDPVDRTWSLFRHHRNKGRVPNNYFEAVKLMPEIESSGRYADYCPRWESEFGEDHCFYIRQDTLECEASKIVDDVCDFIGVERIRLPENASERFGQIRQPRSMSIAKLSAACALRLRTGGMHRVVELLKHAGLKRVLLGPPSKPDPMPAEVRDYLQELHHEDTAYFNNKTRAWNTNRRVRTDGEPVGSAGKDR